MNTKEITQAGVGVAFLAICSFLTIPGPVPVTLQTFGVFFLMLLLGGKIGTITIFVYLLLGAIGVPVFAGMSGGLGAIMGTTGGYLLGFVFIGMTYWYVSEKISQKLFAKIIALILGLILCYAFGTWWFVTVYTRNTGAIGIGTALGWCVIPFLIPDGIKLAVAAVVAPRVRKALEKDV